MYVNCLLLGLMLGFFGYLDGTTSKFYKVDKTGSCPGYTESFPLDLSKLNVFNVKSRSLVIIGVVTANKVIESDIDMQLDARRCDPSGARCISFSNDTYTNVCRFIPNNPVFGDMFARMTKPLFKCFPIKRGEYVVQNLTINMSPFEMLPLQGFRWKVKFYFYKSDKYPKVLLGCWYTETSILATTNRRHSRF